MRPLVASFFTEAVQVASFGVYDEGRGLTLGPTGAPVVDGSPSETLTKVRTEPVDDDRVVLETFTEVRDERTDEDQLFGTETQTRVRSEPVDDDRVVAGTATFVRNEPTDDDPPTILMPPADDCVTGVVSF